MISRILLAFGNIEKKRCNFTNFLPFFQPGFTGVCAVLTYQLQLPEEAEPNYVQVMMSVPYNLNSYYAYLAVGIDTMYLNSTGLFDQLYYYTGPFERSQAGSLVEFTPDDGKGNFKFDLTEKFTNVNFT